AERALEEAPHVDFDLVRRRVLDDVGQLTDDVVDEAIEIATYPRPDRRDLFADTGSPLFDRARLTGGILLQHLDAARELVGRHRDRAPPRVHALLEDARRLDALAERVVEQDAPALFGEELREVSEQLRHAAAVAVTFERALGGDREDDGILDELRELGL